MSKRFVIETLGCRTNQYESQAYTQQLLALGYEPFTGEGEADICLLNSCTVTASADSHSRHKIRSLVRKHPHARIFVTGCMVDQHPSLDIPGVEAWIPNANKENLLKDALGLSDMKAFPEFVINAFEGHTRAFVKVQDGCNSFCSYCIIPYVRGRSRSRGIEEILKEVQGLLDKGYKEIVLTGINIGDFDGGKEKKTLADLIRAVDCLPGLERLRLSSIDPDEVDDELIDVILSGKKTCHSLHLVLQSGSNIILKRMNRKYTKQIFCESVERLRQADPDFGLTTDIIVGFPGESEGDFQETLDLVEETRFAKVHMFPYSRRKGTRAERFSGQISPQLLAERKQRLLRMSERTAFALREDALGRIFDVLTEDRKNPDEISAYTDGFLRVFVQSKKLPKNSLVRVRCIQNSPEGLLAHPI